jgi:NAD(P)-dependent dehydrogenase (short-subunit alcohol dehydrogenase family)
MSDFLQVARARPSSSSVSPTARVSRGSVAKTLEEQGARVVYSVRSEARKKSLETLLAGKPVFLCDVEQPGAAERLAGRGGRRRPHVRCTGSVHSIAFANYSEGFKPFHETKRADFLQATAVSAFSLVEVARAFKPHLAPNALGGDDRHLLAARDTRQLRLHGPDQSRARIQRALPREIVQRRFRGALQLGGRGPAEDERLGRHSRAIWRATSTRRS